MYQLEFTRVHDYSRDDESIAIRMVLRAGAKQVPVAASVDYFFADPMIDKNVLGRTGWLDRVRLGLIHYAHKIYLAPYGPA
jgi:hypothetical protein